MPMGWSRALFCCFCQFLHARIIASALPERPLLVDDAAYPLLHTDAAVASVYVDNFGVEGTNPDIIRDCYQRALRAVTARGLDVHDCVGLTEGLELLGFVVGGDGKGHISIRRHGRLYLAMKYLLNRGHC